MHPEQLRTTRSVVDASKRAKTWANRTTPEIDAPGRSRSVQLQRAYPNSVATRPGTCRARARVPPAAGYAKIPTKSAFTRVRATFHRPESGGTPIAEGLLTTAMKGTDLRSRSVPDLCRESQGKNSHDYRIPDPS